MPEYQGIENTIGAAELVRKAREFGWVACLLYPFPAIAVFAGSLEYIPGGPLSWGGEPPDTSFWVVLSVLIIALFFVHFRMIYVAIRMGGNMKDPEFLRIQRPGILPVPYFFMRVLGISTSSDRARS